jgi:hypothetical protein
VVVVVVVVIAGSNGGGGGSGGSGGSGCGSDRAKPILSCLPSRSPPFNQKQTNCQQSK